MDAAELVEEINNGEVISFRGVTGDFDYEVGFEDYVAGTLTAEVERYIENLERVPGVLKAHRDGHKVMINATTPQGDLDKWSRIWWTNRLMEMETLPDPGGV